MDATTLETQMFGEVRDFFAQLPCSGLNVLNSVRRGPPLADMDMALDNIVPESLNWRHTDEGPE